MVVQQIFLALGYFDECHENEESLFVMCHGHEGCSFFRHQIVQMSPSEHAVVDDAGEDDGTEKKKKKLDLCLVIPPPKGKKAKSIIKFFGGAFIGAVPKVTYGNLLGLLANEGYLIISVPYNVTFDHSQVAREVFERFHSYLNSVLTYGLPSDDLLAAKLIDLPLYSVGHSYFSDKLPKVRDLESHLAEERKTRQKQENGALAVASSHPSPSSLKQGLTTISEKKPLALWNPSSKMRLPLRKSAILCLLIHPPMPHKNPSPSFPASKCFFKANIYMYIFTTYYLLFIQQ
ncbi:alpha/beta hydrolase fold protein [Tanacetum coccineum]|uniref:Alpha/beta hydrolase fold protein n=1 Tax=Tanacetum coccineum TaxID=301880 RepID=A0ABQ5BZV8_9ASTR